MHHTVGLVVLLVVVVIALVMAAKRLDVPYPIMLVVGGALLGFVPKLPVVSLDPDMVLLVVLPPLLFAAAWTTSWRDFRANARSIGLLSVGLVLATTALTAVTAHAMLDLPWPAAFALGAIVSPTDAIAATSIADRLGVPRRMVTILEGESLVNDASGLVAYRLAVSAVASAGFSVGHAVWEFAFLSGGGILVGLAVGWVFTELERRIEDPPVEIALTLIVAYGAYLGGELLGTSGVLACVSAGLYSGRQSPRVFAARSRLQANGVWETMVFLLNGLVFVLLGLQLRRILGALGAAELPALTLRAFVIGVVVIVARMVWMFPGTFGPRLFASVRTREPKPSWQRVVVMGWAGMRGAVSLALALALPVASERAPAFPGRDAILYTTFVVILMTLVGQGLTLPPLIRFFGIRDDGGDEHEEVVARLRAAQAAQKKLPELAESGGIAEDAAAHLDAHYEGRVRRLEERLVEHEQRHDGRVPAVVNVRSGEQRGYRWLQHALVRVEREALIELRNAGSISDGVLHRVERDLDLAEARYANKGRAGRPKDG